MLTVFLTYLLFPLCLWLFLLSADRRSICAAGEWLLYALGLAPALTALYLYYALLCFPGLHSLFYVIPVCVFFVMMGAVALGAALPRVSSAWRAWRNRAVAMPPWRKVELAAFWAVLLLPLAWFVFHYLRYALWCPLIGHDVLEYACEGRFFYEKLSIRPFFETTVPDLWVTFRSKHAPSFPLLLTWELLLSASKESLPDLFFRTVGTWYGLLILAVQCFWLSKLNRWLGVLGVAAMLSNSWFFGAIVRDHHLDTFRIFLLVLSWIWLARHIRDDDRLSLYVFGACSGLAAFAHSIGAFIVAINLAALVVFSGGGFRRRLGKAVLVGLLILLFGGAHYVIDVFWGRGWVFGR